MAVTVTKEVDSERGTYYVIGLSADGDVAQVHLQSRLRLAWQRGDVSWHKTASVAATFTNAGDAAMAISGGNGTLTGWVNHPDTANSEAAETLPITGLRFTASAATQQVILYTGEDLLNPPVDAGTPA